MHDGRQNGLGSDYLAQQLDRVDRADAVNACRQVVQEQNAVGAAVRGAPAIIVRGAPVIIVREAPVIITTADRGEAR
ncbi:hypothetical protein [Mycobacterium arosiense]|uniref:hypothetical protein n=1 Tax=Mycobacterium arosiense TaxID=425468 RepID=UPI00114F951D|nr:hypothetical protein [Mycobacterium arosiense]